MHFHIFCNQKNISSSHENAIKEFEKRLSAYCETDLTVTLAPTPAANINGNNCHIIIITKGISNLSSEQFSEKIKDLQLSGKSHIVVYILYPEQQLYEQLSDFLTDCTIHRLSFSNLELSPETLTLLFYEQLYRGYTILQGKTYHK